MTDEQPEPTRVQRFGKYWSQRPLFGLALLLCIYDTISCLITRHWQSAIISAMFACAVVFTMHYVGKLKIARNGVEGNSADEVETDAVRSAINPRVYTLLSLSGADNGSNHTDLVIAPFGTVTEPMLLVIATSNLRRLDPPGKDPGVILPDSVADPVTGNIARFGGIAVLTRTGLSDLPVWSPDSE